MVIHNILRIGIVSCFALILDLLVQDFRAALTFWLENGLLYTTAVVQMYLL